MAKGQHLSQYQQGIVKRYYDHIDSATSQKLAELVSDLYLSSPPDGAQALKLWKSAEKALAKTPADPKRVEAIITTRDIKKLAELAGELAPGGRLSR